MFFNNYSLIYPYFDYIRINILHLPNGIIRIFQHSKKKSNSNLFQQEDNLIFPTKAHKSRGNIFPSPFYF